MTKSKSTKNPALAALILRIGLAAVFIYAAVDAFREPNAWLGFIPTFTNSLIHPKTLLDIISIGQLLLASWLITGKYVKYAASLSAILLIGIMVTNPHTLVITFRDIGLIAAAAALFVL